MTVINESGNYKVFPHNEQNLDTYNQCSIIKSFIKIYNKDNFSTLPSKNAYNPIEMLTNSIDLKSFYVICKIGIKESETIGLHTTKERYIDISFASFDNDNLYFFRPFLSSSVYRIMDDIVKYIDNNINRSIEDWSTYSNLFRFLLRHNIIEPPIELTTEPGVIKFYIFKLNPEKLYTSYNINLFKLNLISNI